MPDGSSDTIVRGALARSLDTRLSLFADSGFSGAVLVAVSDTVILSKGYGWTDSTRRIPVAPSTQFNVASVSKSFTAAAVLRLREQGRLRLTDSLSRLLVGARSAGREMTVHHLLTHTAGLGQNYAATGIADRDSAVAAILAEPLRFGPGEDFGYSDDGYSLLAAIVEVAAGEPFEHYVERELLQPARLRQTGFWGYVDDLDATRVAQKLEPLPPEIRAPNWGYRGAGGMWSTVGDLRSWLLALRSGRVLSRESVRLLWTTHIQLRSTSVGYGWFTSETDWGTEIWTRGGESWGHNAVVRWFPTRDAVIIVASNAGERLGGEANRVVSAAVAEILFAKAP